MQKNNSLLITSFYSVLVLFIAYFTYFQNYHQPAKQFWDENYHIPSAQKYIDGVAYMETHPPLGKLIIALGEYIINPNENINKDEFLRKDYIKKLSRDLSYEGYRLFPTFFATLNALLFLFICHNIFKNIHLSFLLSFLYLFENAYIVHSRAAMLESIQMFFILLSILYFFIISQKDKIKLFDYALLGFIIGLAVSVKLNGLIMILLVFFLFLFEDKSNGYVKYIFSQVIKYIVSALTLIVTFVFVFYIHFALGTKMPTHKNYNISNEYKTIIKNGETSSIKNVPIMLRDNLIFIKDYSKGVPRYNPCKKGENGSFCLTWPFGNKSINYRWEKSDGKVKYLYLHGNTIIWFSAFLGALLAFSLVVSRFVYNVEIKNKNTFNYIFIFLSMYLSYMFVMFNIERVMYLYHYFVPLMFTIILLLLMLYYIFEEKIKEKNLLFYLSIAIFAINIYYVYEFFSPLTYYEPLSTYEFELRNWFDFWRLQSVK